MPKGKAVHKIPPPIAGEKSVIDTITETISSFGTTEIQVMQDGRRKFVKLQDMKDQLIVLRFVQDRLKDLKENIIAQRRESAVVVDQNV